MLKTQGVLEGRWAGPLAPLQKRAWRLSKMKGFVKSCISLKPQTPAACICVETQYFCNKKTKNYLRKNENVKHTR